MADAGFVMRGDEPAGCGPTVIRAAKSATGASSAVIIFKGICALRDFFQQQAGVCGGASVPQGVSAVKNILTRRHGDTENIMYFLIIELILGNPREFVIDFVSLRVPVSPW